MMERKIPKEAFRLHCFVVHVSLCQEASKEKSSLTHTLNTSQGSLFILLQKSKSMKGTSLGKMAR